MAKNAYEKLTDYIDAYKGNLNQCEMAALIDQLVNELDQPTLELLYRNLGLLLDG